MKIEIKEKKENKLLGRTEVKGKLVFEGATPSKEALKDRLAIELKGDKELMVVKEIYPRFSYQEADFLVYVYEDKAKKEKMEIKKKAKKGEEQAKKEEEQKGAGGKKKGGGG